MVALRTDARVVDTVLYLLASWVHSGSTQVMAAALMAWTVLSLLRALAGAVVAAAHSSTVCPAGTLAVGATPDGTWQVCERTLSLDA